MDLSYNRDFILPTSDTAKKVINDFLYNAETMVLSGPRNCGKTAMMIACAFELHRNIPGLRSAFIRNEMRSIAPTFIPSAEKIVHYPFDHNRSPIRKFGGKNPSSLLFSNGGEMVLGGLTEPEKWRGGEFDLVIINQAERMNTQETLSDVAATVSGGRAGNWRTPDGKKRFLLMMDANPGSPFHFLYQNKEDYFWYDWTHKDCPPYYNWRKQQWTLLGNNVLESLLRAYPEGFDRRRMVYGEWVAAEGQVYNGWDPDRHVEKLEVDQFKSKEFKFYLGVDWGFTAPSAACFIAYKAQTKEFFVLKEIYETGLTGAEFAQKCVALADTLGIKIINSFTDHDPADEQAFADAKLNPKQADKKDKIAGIEVVKNILAADKLIVNKNSLVARDRSIPDAPQGIKEEILGYRYKDPSKMDGSRKDDEPEKGQANHGLDALRYALVCLTKHQRTFLPKPGHIDYVLPDRTISGRG